MFQIPIYLLSPPDTDRLTRNDLSASGPETTIPRGAAAGHIRLPSLAYNLPAAEI